jgi:hypothetical protein
MSFYTVELRKLVNGGYNLGLDKYPIHDESHRPILNGKIVEWYYMREIGYETPELFINRLNARMNVIMPQYNQLYYSAQLEFDPLTNVKIHTVGDSKNVASGTEKSDGTSNSTSHNEGDSTATQYDTPQTMLDFNTEDYMSGRSRSVSTSDAAGTGTDHRDTVTGQTSQSDTMGDTSGYSGVSPAALIMEYRATIVNIDRLIIQELADLFMGLATPRGRDH